jgi:hypothetical protein
VILLLCDFDCLARRNLDLGFVAARRRKKRPGSRFSSACHQRSPSAFDYGFCFLYRREGLRRSDGEVQTFGLER